MKPYGIRWDYADDCCGPTSKYCGAKLWNRHRDRQIMHHQGRVDGRRELARRISEMELEEER